MNRHARPCAGIHVFELKACHGRDKRGHDSVRVIEKWVDRTEYGMSNSVHKGGCACGKVSVEARGEPYRVGVCHCLTCRKLHGMPFSFYAVFPPEAVTITGEVATFASSEHGRRYFCPACGSQIYSHYSRADEIYVYPGSFDDPGLWQPTYELWTIRREPWLPEFPSVVSRYEKDRPKWSRTEPE